MVMPALPGERDRAVSVEVKPGTEADQSAHRARPLGDERADRCLIAEPGARVESVPQVAGR